MSKIYKKTYKHKIKVKKLKGGSKKTMKVYTKKDFSSGDGMLTSVWGPSMWHFLHTMSFNYPVEPTKLQKQQYKEFILNLQNILPCKYCRMNLANNLKVLPLTQERLKNRDSFSRYIYELHEHINKMLGKKSGLKYCDVRERYEHFRSRCTLDLKMNQEEIEKILEEEKKKQKKETGCTEPLYGKKSKCVIKIVPQDEKVETFQMDKKCIKLKL